MQDRDHRTRDIEVASLRPPLQIAGHELRPFGLASFVLLRRMGNRLVAGGMSTTPGKDGKDVIDFNDPENIEAVLQFIYVHSAPLRDVIRCADDAGLLREAVLIHTADISLDTLAASAGEITSTISTAARAIAVPGNESTDDGETSDPNAHGPRG